MFLRIEEAVSRYRLILLNGTLSHYVVGKVKMKLRRTQTEDPVTFGDLYASTCLVCIPTFIINF